MAINAQWLASNNTISTTAVQLYTVAASTASTYAYSRDLVVTNAGTATVFVGLSTLGTVATSTASFQVPTGGSLILTQCQVPSGAVLSAITGSGTTSVSVGFALNVTYV